MKKTIFLVILSILAGVYFLGGKRLTEEDIEKLHADYNKAFVEMDTKATCKMMAREYEQKMTVSMESQQEELVVDKAAFCDTESKNYGDQWNLGSKNKKLSSRIEYRNTITGIMLAPDRKSAQFETRGVLQIPGAINMTWKGKSTVVRRRWRTVVTHSEHRVWIGPAYQ